MPSFAFEMENLRSETFLFADLAEKDFSWVLKVKTFTKILIKHSESGDTQDKNAQCESSRMKLYWLI